MSLLLVRLALIFVVFSTVLYVLTRRDRFNVRAIVMGAFLLRVLATVFVNVFPVIPYTRDYRKYHMAMEMIVSGWATGSILPIDPVGVVNVYAYLVAPVYAVAPSTVAVELFNGLLGALVVYNVYQIAATIYDPSRASLTALIVAAYPSFIHYTSILMRDALIVYISSEIVLALVLWLVNERNPRKLALLLPVAIVLRPENLSYLLPVVVVAAFVKFGASIPVRKKLAIGAVISSVAFGLFILALLVFPNEIPTPTPEALSARRAWLARGTGDIGGNYLGSISFDSWLDVLAFAPVGAAYFLLVPLPWMADLSNPFTIVAFLENLFLLYPIIGALVLRSKRSGRVSRTEAVLLAVLIPGTISYGLVEGNMGPAMRHRLQFTYLIFVLSTPVLPIVTPFPVRDVAEQAQISSNEQTQTLP